MSYTVKNSLGKEFEVPDGYITMKEYKVQENLPEEMCAVLLDECEKCNAPIIVSDSGKLIECSNPDCLTKLGRRMELMCKTLKIANFGYSTCELFINECGLTTLRGLFELEPEDYPEKYSMLMREKLFVSLHKNKKFTLATLLKAFHLTGLADDAEKVLKGYDNINTFFEDLDSHGELLLADKLNIGVTGGRTLNILNQLQSNREEITKFVGLFEVESTAEVLFNIAITEGVNALDPSTGKKFSNKDEYVSYLSSLGKGRIVRKDKVNLQCAYLVADQCDLNDPDTWTGQVKSAKKWELQGKNIKVVTSAELIDIIKNM